ncbi:hypothetical protein BKH46_03850 [Helicobacter sp. 12S02634-8]|uniref:TonB-dependent receptor n=1 Tax=Helicobacter sp. 12S02634-8 TaxID=1476199 RepID=UPI000BA6040C|nr:TonB-dependent receptor [Helicobacter sp. 12S02634-8]PAF47568.1 hypothetical protein BKH46_03850 [Helicobacter sp. 12S02634-8]
MRVLSIFMILFLVFECSYTKDSISTNEAMLDKIITAATGFDTELKDEPRNILLIDKQTLSNKGYQSLDEALRYTPLLSFADNGFGGNIDLRGQGDKANTAIKVLINRMPINLLDTSHGITPIAMINIEDIESIEVIPGGGAVVYGNGTRGGVINIKTKQNPRNYAAFTLKGGSYESKNGLFGRADIAAGKIINKHLFIRADGSVANTSGYRKGDSLLNYYAGLEAIYTLSNASIDLNTNYSHSILTTSPAISLAEVKKDRRAQGDGHIKSLQDFASVSMDYKYNTQQWGIDLLGFYEMDSVDYVSDIAQMSSMGLSVPFDQSGSRFFNQAAGLNAKAKYTKGKNTLLFGYDLLYQNAYRKAKAHYALSIPMMKMKTIMHMDHSWVTDLDTHKVAHSIYALERYFFGDHFDLSGGARYEISQYFISRDKHSQMLMNSKGAPKTDPHYAKTTFRNNYALELTPNFKYSPTGNIYAKYERGFITPAPNQLSNSDKAGIYYNHLKPEVYDTFELGYRDEFAYSYVSATLYYTLTQDEINVNQIEHGTTWTYTNLDQTQRLGAEIIAIQDLLDSNALHINESLSYVNAQITKGAHKGEKVPLAREYKITFGIAYDLLKTSRQFLSIFTNNAFFGTALDTSYTPIKAYHLTDLGLNYSLGGLRFNVGVRNLFDSQYFSYQLAKSQDTYIPAGYIAAAGRSYYAELRYDF